MVNYMISYARSKMLYSKILLPYMTHFHTCVMHHSFHEMERQGILRKLRLKLIFFIAFALMSILI